MTDAEEWKVSLPSWRDGPARRSVIAFLQEITQGPGALPLADRIAAFDNDGTLACEKPHTALAGFLLDRAAAAGSARPEVGSGHDVLRELGVLFNGQTTAQYEEQARRYLAAALHPRFHRPYPTLTYQPVLAAGNAAGDIDMLRAARFALVVHHDDDERAYAYDDRQILDAAARGRAPSPGSARAIAALPRCPGA